MFEDAAYDPEVVVTRPVPNSVLSARHNQKAAAYWLKIDQELTAAMRASPHEVWVRREWAVIPGEGGCLGASYRLRFRRAFPPQLAGMVAEQEWAAWHAQLADADAEGKFCLSKPCAVTIFILLFYFTIVGVLIYLPVG